MLDCAGAMSNSELLREAQRHYPGFPSAGPDGQEFESWEIEVRNNIERHDRLIAPSRPQQEYEECDWEVDEFGEEYAVNVRQVVLSEEEFEQRLNAYEAALAEWKRTGGVSFSHRGPPLISGKFVCRDGKRCEGILVGTEWRWTSLERCF